MFDSNFSYKSATPLPPALSLNDALQVLHDFETVNKLNPDVRGAKPIISKSTPKRFPSAKPATEGDTPIGDLQSFLVEDTLPFIPKKLWANGVTYQADFLPVQSGCDITIYAPGGFTSVNHWRLIHDETEQMVLEGEKDVRSKNLGHTENDGGAWSVQIVSDAKCNLTFASFVRGFLKNSHAQLQHAFIQKCVEMRKAPPITTRTRRPTIGRRKSSVF